MWSVNIYTYKNILIYESKLSSQVISVVFIQTDEQQPSKIHNKQSYILNQ